MDSYSVEVKPSARKELEALPDQLLGRVFLKLAPLDAESSKATKINGECVWGTGMVHLIDDDARLVSVTHIGHRRVVYD